MKLAALLVLVFSFAVIEAFRGHRHSESNSEESSRPFPPSGGRKPGHGGSHPGQGGHGSHSPGSGDHGAHGGHGGHFHPVPPFLQNVTKEGLREFFKIFFNQSLTKAELKAELEAWADEQNVTESFKEEEQKVKEAREEARVKARELLENVTVLLEEIQDIEDNMNITRGEERKQKMKLIHETSRPVLIVYASLKRSVKKEQSRPHNHPGGRFPGRHDKFPRPLGGFLGNQGQFGNGNGSGGLKSRSEKKERSEFDLSGVDDLNFENFDAGFTIDDGDDFYSEN